MSAINTALSGMKAAEYRLGVSANNVANALSTGRVGAKAGEADAAYQAQTTVQSSVAGGGVTATTQPATPPTVNAYAPTDANANGEGLVELPNVDFTIEQVEQMMSVTGYKANAEVVRTQQSMDRALLDIKV